MVTAEQIIKSPLVRRLIELARDEDLPNGDITSIATVDARVTGRASILARERLVICGLPLIQPILEVFGCKLALKLSVDDGQSVSEGTELATLMGNAREILKTERTILNFLQRLSGVASFTQAVVSQAQGLKVLDTRKTTPGWRELEKYAVQIGGGTNHRQSLSDLILVKNNHIDANRGSVSQTLSRIASAKPKEMRVEVEVRTLEELSAALPFAPEIVMFDNMDDTTIAAGVKLVRAGAPQTIIEVSGGVNATRLSKLKALGIDCVSMGALTTQSRSVDISLRLSIG